MTRFYAGGPAGAPGEALALKSRLGLARATYADRLREGQVADAVPRLGDHAHGSPAHAARDSLAGNGPSAVQLQARSPRAPVPAGLADGNGDYAVEQSRRRVDGQAKASALEASEHAERRIALGLEAPMGVQRICHLLVVAVVAEDSAGLRCVPGARRERLPRQQANPVPLAVDGGHRHGGALVGSQRRRADRRADRAVVQPGPVEPGAEYPADSPRPSWDLIARIGHLA